MSLGGERRGVAAVEFAIAMPMLLLMLGGMADYGLLMRNQSQLATGVAVGAQYAMLRGTAVSTTTITAMIQNSSQLTGVTVSTTGPACYCLSTRPVTPTNISANSCTGSCPDATVPGSYLFIAATYPYAPTMPLLSMIANLSVVERATVRLQ